MKKKRNSNIELLRLLCVVGIVSMHVFGLYKKDDLVMTGGTCTLFNNAICNFGTSVFMLISGYYGLSFKKEKLFSLWNLTLFWSIVLIGVNDDFSAKYLAKSIFPILTGKYWFITAYIIIYCLSSYIEELITRLSKRQFLQMLAILLFFFYVAPTFLIFDILHDSGKGVVNLFIIYLVGRYIALFGYPEKIYGFKWCWLFFIIIFFVFFINLSLTFVSGVLFQKLSRDNSIFTLFEAVAVLCMVLQMEPHTSRRINNMAGYVFPIYVIHSALIPRFIHIPESTHSFLYPMIWANALTISLICVGLEFVRRLILDKPFRLLVNKEIRLTEMITQHLKRV